MSLSKGMLGWIVGIVLIVEMGVATTWRMQTRSEAQSERATQERIRKDVQDNINKSMSGVKMCPLSDPDCNKR